MKIYTVPEAAKLMHIRKGEMYELIYTGKIRAFRLSERGIRITDDALLDFIKKGENKGCVER